MSILAGSMMMASGKIKVTIGVSQFDMNLKTWLTANTSWNGTSRAKFEVTIAANIKSNSTATPALDIAAFPSDTEITLLFVPISGNVGSVRGAGGAGGVGGSANSGATAGGAGGDAIRSDQDLIIDPTDSKIWGGGGGGGGGGSAITVHTPPNFTMGGGGGGGGGGLDSGTGGAGGSTGVDVAGIAGGAANSFNGGDAGSGGASSPGNAGAGGAGGDTGVAGASGIDPGDTVNELALTLGSSAAGGAAGKAINFTGGSVTWLVAPSNQVRGTTT